MCHPEPRHVLAWVNSPGANESCEHRDGTLKSERRFLDDLLGPLTLIRRAERDRIEPAP